MDIQPELIIGIFIAVVLIVIFSVTIFILIKKRGSTSDKDYYANSVQVKENLGTKLRRLFGGKTLDEASFQHLEEVLVSADIGPAISYELIEKLKNQNIGKIEDAITFLKGELKEYFTDKTFSLEKGKLNIILILGVNGVGKTTSIAKLANLYLNKGFKVLLAAGDTFRAAATEQLTKWAQRLEVPIVKQGEKADSASVVFDAVDSAKAKGVDLLIVDTAGRLHNKANLMEELKKIEKVIRTKGECIRKNLLVIDATTGQNAFLQAEAFNNAIDVDGIIMTKYDAQTKGGIVFTIEKKLEIPFYFIGSGEKVEDLGDFHREDFVEKIFD